MSLINIVRNVSQVAQNSIGMLKRRTTFGGFLSIRYKYNQNKGVKGIRNRKSFYEAKDDVDIEEETVRTYNTDTVFLEDRAYEEVANGAMHITRGIAIAHNVLLIQPYVKWGPKRNYAVQPSDQLAEAEALIRSLPNWKISLSLKVPLESFERKTLFGSGKIEELKAIIQEVKQRSIGVSQSPLTCLFISKDTLTFCQKRYLEAEFKLPVMDRYSVVIQILRLHATSAEAKLQVAMAEIPYIWAQAKDANVSQSRKQGYSLNDMQREILRTRERKLRMELERIRNHRKLLRSKRKQKNYPIIAVVGYTNAGKTSLIKALAMEETMQPRDQLFATLDVTAHGGVLPCNLQVIYMDTVGFMSDLPTGLIECFIATLEDAMLADVIVHVQDLSHPCYAAQRQHVETTLHLLSQNINNELKKTLPPIINVCNKVDLLAENAKSVPPDVKHLVSAKEQTGLQSLLNDIEQHILNATGRRKLCMRVPNGGPEMSWLYKNVVVVKMQADEKNSEMLLMHIVTTESVLQRFKKLFC